MTQFPVLLLINIHAITPFHWWKTILIAFSQRSWAVTGTHATAVVLRQGTEARNEL